MKKTKFILETKSKMDGIDATYGLQGKAKKWGALVGGAKQFVTPFDGNTLRQLGILIERK